MSGALNFRDTGGLPAGGSVTRHGVLFRSGNLAAMDASGAEALGALGIRRIVDLREDIEIEFEPTDAAWGELTLRVPLFVGSSASFFDDDLTLDDMYRTLIDGSADRIVDVVRAVVNDQPVLVHCTVGKDRTGVSVALALAAAGVDADAVIADYARTEALLPPARNERVVRILRQRFPNAKNLEELATRSPARVMAGLLADLEARFGGAGQYLVAHGLTEAELRELRRILVA